MRTLSLFAAALLAAGPLAAQQAAPAAKQADPDKAVAGSGALPEGWNWRPDRAGAALANVKFSPMGKGYHVTLGPSLILWRDADRVNGPFHTLATFTQQKPAAHPEGYGLLIGGQALNGEGQKYTYFLVRQDGKFLIKERNGAETKDVTAGWVDHAAVQKPGADGTAVNKLEVDGKASTDKVRFMVNGQVVHEMDPKDVDSNGIVGFRVNHNLDVHIDGFDIHRM